VKMVGRRVDFGGVVRESGGAGGRGKVAVEATPVKASPYGIFGRRDGGDGDDGAGEGKSIYDAWNDMDDYEELA
jgi:hypothetical protein